MAFTAKDVQHLREMTGVGMMECKKALTQAEGDFDKAIEFLREKGLAAAKKKAGRIAAEGVVYTTTCMSCGDAVIVEVNSETDFVAKNDNFQGFVAGVANTILKTKPANVEDLLTKPYDDKLDVAAALQDHVLVIGENLKIRRFEVIPGGADVLNVGYIHMGGKIGVLVSLKVDPAVRDNAAVAELGRDIAMQICAMNPQYLNRDAVPEDIVAKEREILMAQTLEEGKPEKVAARIVDGRIAKFYQDNCLVDQAFVKDSKVTITQQIASVAKAVGGSIGIASYFRFEKGEGLAKREENFAEEIAKLAK
ncbi:MAG: translation elongation factor Ts [Clostridiaceae bacterium]|nr:translation elongation factor Ts [Clostridiaceae bacterium]